MILMGVGGTEMRLMTDFFRWPVLVMEAPPSLVDDEEDVEVEEEAEEEDGGRTLIS
jgi:hypothetical protein